MNTEEQVLKVVLVEDPIDIIHVTSPSGKKFTIDINEPFIPEETGEYIFESPLGGGGGGWIDKNGVDHNVSI